MQVEQQPIGPAIRRRFSELPIDARIDLRTLTAEFGRYVPPEIAYRRWQQVGAGEVGPMDAVTLTYEQQVSLGTMRVIADTMSRLGAKFDGPRKLSSKRSYYLPVEAREVRSMGRTFLATPSIQSAIAHLERRFAQIAESKARSWTLDDMQATQTILTLAQAAIREKLVDDLMSAVPTVPEEPEPTTDHRLEEPTPINPKLPTEYEMHIRSHLR